MARKGETIASIVVYLVLAGIAVAVALRFDRYDPGVYRASPPTAAHVQPAGGPP